MTLYERKTTTISHDKVAYGQATLTKTEGKKYGYKRHFYSVTYNDAFCESEYTENFETKEAATKFYNDFLRNHK